MNLGLIPIRNFGIVLPEVYRSAQPLYNSDYKWLIKIGVRKIINLRAESRHDRMAKRLGLKVINISVPDHFTPTKSQIDRFRKHIGKGVLFHCAHGHGRTSTFSVITHMLNGKTAKEAIVVEFLKYGYQFRHKKQLEFLQKLKLIHSSKPKNK